MMFSWIRTLVLCATLCVVIFPVKSAFAYEPVTAMDDVFTVPRSGYLTESAATFPGTESFVGHTYGVLAWQQPYGIEELAVNTVHVGGSYGAFGISGTFASSGFDLWGEELAKLGVSYAPVSSFSAGVRLTRPALRIKNFGSAAAYTVDAGMVWCPLQDVVVAGSMENIGGTTIGESHEALNGATRLSVSWQADSMFSLFTMMRKVSGYDSSVAAGFAAHVAGPLTIGAAGGTEPDRVEYLVDIEFRCFRVGYRGAYHPSLGMSHGCSLVWNGIPGE